MKTFKNKLRFIFLFGVLLTLLFPALANPPDSAYLFSYATTKNFNKNGLHFAWSIDGTNWHSIGPEHAWVRNDYGNWSTEKRMLTPVLFRSPEGVWHLLWSVNERDPVIAHSASEDLVYWGRQSYPEVSEGNCLLPDISYDTKNKAYTVSWLGANDKDTLAFSATTSDFKDYSSPEPIPLSQRQDTRKAVMISGTPETGSMFKVSWELIDNLIKSWQAFAYREGLASENARTDALRFASLKPLELTLTPDLTEFKSMSTMLMGVFFEDINYGADGGLYAELVQNRDFEYALSDRKEEDPNWNSTTAWHLKGTSSGLRIDTLSPIHPNNKHYVVLQTSEPGIALVNEGYDGIPLKEDDRYDFSVFARLLSEKEGSLIIRLVGTKGENYGETSIQITSPEWEKYEARITARVTTDQAVLEIVPRSMDSLALDMISLFPENTFKGHKNGLRADLAQVIADLHPRFVRFPGGCVAHGDGIANIYRWKNTVGPLETRKPQRNIWGYHQSAGLGYFEYFQFCEDLGAEPLPVVAAGVPCQNSSVGGAGQQGGIPLCDMGQYVQDILDLIEYANGDASSKWGKVRAEAGHPEPFNLKYIGIGNEDLITDIFETRYIMLIDAVREKYPEITVIGTVGPFFEGTDYEEGWKLATRLKLPIVDEHYYRPPGWFINNQDFYDKYDRTKSKVYLGEYASWGSTLYNALAEAIYLTALERNADVVLMSSYAPLLAREGHTQWNPDLIYFNHSEIKPTVNYYVQKLFGQHTGDLYVPVEINLSNTDEAVRKRVGVSMVYNSENQEIIVKMVNILPVPVNTVLNLEDLEIEDDEAEIIVLKGMPDDKALSPVEYGLPLNQDPMQIGLPAYSLTVLRFNRNAKVKTGK